MRVRERERSQTGGLRRLDAALLAAGFLLLIPVYRISGLPFRMDLAELARAYWVAMAAESIALAALLCVVALPVEQTLMPIVCRLRARPVLALGGPALAACLVAWLGWRTGLLMTVDALAVAELLLRRGRDFERSMLDVVIPAAYLFCGVLLLYSFNHALAGIQFAGGNDGLMARLDAQWFGFSASRVAHLAQQFLPGWVFALLEFGYFGLYGRLGAALALVALLDGRGAAIKMVRTMMLGYAIAVAIFAVLPVKGPYLTCTLPEAAHGHATAAWETEQALVEKVRLLDAHRTDGEAGTIDVLDYYIGFPSMHAALPLIALWSLRRRRRAALCMGIVYAGLLLPATILLEWHYLIDLVGGVLTAAAAIALSERLEWAHAPAEPVVETEEVVLSA